MGAIADVSNAKTGLTAEFKRESVRLLEGSDKPVTQLTAELGGLPIELCNSRPLQASGLQVHGDLLQSNADG